MTAIRVLLVDDHPLFRQGVAYTLSREPEIDVVGEAASGKQALVLARSLAPVSRPGRAGEAALVPAAPAAVVVHSGDGRALNLVAVLGNTERRGRFRLPDGSRAFAHAPSGLG